MTSSPSRSTLRGSTMSSPASTPTGSSSSSSPSPPLTTSVPTSPTSATTAPSSPSTASSAYSLPSPSPPPSPTPVTPPRSTQIEITKILSDTTAIMATDLEAAAAQAKIKETILVEKLKRYEVTEAKGPMVKPETLTGEEHFYMKKMAQKGSNCVSVGRRGVFGGVILNMHLDWKKHETIKVVCKPCKPGQVHEYARDIARLSGGMPIQVIGGDIIIFYRGKNYVQPEVMLPIDTLSKKKRRIEEYEADGFIVDDDDEEVEEKDDNNEEWHRSKKEETETTALSRIARSGWRAANARPRRVSGINSGKTYESFHEIESSPSLHRSVGTRSNVSGINVHSSGLKDGLPFGARGISVMPHCPAPSMKRVDYELDVETEKLRGWGRRSRGRSLGWLFLVLVGPAVGF